MDVFFFGPFSVVAQMPDVVSEAATLSLSQMEDLIVSIVREHATHSV